NKDSIEVFNKTLAENNLVQEVVYQESLIDMVNKNIRIIGLIILGFACILLIIAVALINNTIRLAVYSQRLLIKSMQMVGATKSFIRSPYIGHGTVHQLLAAIIAIIIVLVHH